MKLDARANRRITEILYNLTGNELDDSRITFIELAEMFRVAIKGREPNDDIVAYGGATYTQEPEISWQLSSRDCTGPYRNYGLRPEC